MNLTHRISRIELAITVLMILGSLVPLFHIITRRHAPEMIDVRQVVPTYSLGTSDLTNGELYEAMPSALRGRTALALSDVVRGTIIDRRGRPLAYDQDGERIYVDANAFADTVGVTTVSRIGLSGLEYSYNDLLLGRSRITDVWRERILRLPTTGANIQLTLDSQIQHAASVALSGYRGSVVVLDANSGAVYAMVSNPSPGYRLSTHGQYPPGSTFKTVILAAALDSRQTTLDTMFDFGQPFVDANGRIYYQYRVDGTSIADYNHAEATLDLAQSFVVSANYTFAELAEEMPPATLTAYAERFGFGFSADDKFPLRELGSMPSRLIGNHPDPMAYLEASDALRAQTGIGQGEVLATPLQMALVAATFVNGGSAPRPYLVESVQRHENSAFDPQLWHGNWIDRGVKRQTANAVRDLMIEVVENERGTGASARIPGFVVGGKTGTAEDQPNTAPHAWFVGFVESDVANLAIAVLVENGGSGGSVAAPIFAEVGYAALTYLGADTAYLDSDDVFVQPPAYTEAGKPVLYLTFDDGPNPEYTPPILEVLDRHGVQATFFLVGSRVEAHVALTEEIQRQGHAIGNHTYDHKDLTILNRLDIARQIEGGAAALQAAIQPETNRFAQSPSTSLLRLPYGVWNAQVSEVAAFHQHRIVPWNVDSRDWDGASAELLVERIVSNVYPGAIILMHDGPEGQDRSQTVEAVDMLIPALEELGYAMRSIPKPVE